LRILSAIRCFAKVGARSDRKRDVIGAMIAAIARCRHRGLKAIR
jgi:hypothetical protein